MNSISKLSAIVILISACTAGSSPTTADGDATLSADTLQQTASQEQTSAQVQAQPGEKHTYGGMVVISPEKLASVTVLMGGTVNKLPMRPGQFVNKGSVVATLSNTEFIALQQDYLEAAAQTDYLEAEYQRQQTLSAGDAASKKKMQQSKADYLTMKYRKQSAAMQWTTLGMSPEQVLKNGIVNSLPVTSPISGYVGDITANLGKYVSVGDRLCSVIDKEGIRILFTVFSKDIGDMQTGKKLRVTVNSLPNESFEAVVTSIDPIMDHTSNSLRVYAKPTSHHSRLMPGMYVRAESIY